MSNKSKNVGTVAKAKIYLESIDPFPTVAMRLADYTFCSVHFAAVSCKVSLSVYGIRIYKTMWCGVVELNLLSETTVDNDFLCSKISRDTNYALSLRQYINGCHTIMDHVT